MRARVVAVLMAALFAGSCATPGAARTSTDFALSGTDSSLATPATSPSPPPMPVSPTPTPTPAVGSQFPVSPTVVPTTVPTLERPQVVRNGDAGAVVEVQVGDRVEVILSPPNAASNWVPTDLASFTLVSSSGGYPSQRPLDALYRATGAGTSELILNSDAPCQHGSPPCAIALPAWRVTIAVIAVPHGTATSTPTLERPARLTNSDDGSVAEIKIGEQVEIVLDPLSAMENWQLPNVATTGLTLVSSTGGYPSTRPFDAIYRATTIRNASLIITTDLTCRHLPTPCAGPQSSWKVWAAVLTFGTG